VNFTKPLSNRDFYCGIKMPQFERTPGYHVHQISRKRRVFSSRTSKSENRKWQRIRGGRRVTYRELKERERVTGYRHKGDSLTAVRLIGVTGWKINGLARVVQGWAKGAGRRRSRGMAPWQPPHTNSLPLSPFLGLSFSYSLSLSVYLHFSAAVLVPLVTSASTSCFNHP